MKLAERLLALKVSADVICQMWPERTETTRLKD